MLLWLQALTLHLASADGAEGLAPFRGGAGFRKTRYDLPQPSRSKITLYSQEFPLAAGSSRHCPATLGLRHG